MSGKINAIDQLRLSLNILSRDDVLKIHTATLEVIESIGVRFPSHKALNILEAHGATVDRETMIAKIPGRVVEDALKTAPPIYTLAARDPAQDLPLDGRHVFLGTDGCCIEVIDAFTGERRRTTKKDSEDCARVADALEEIGFWWSMVAAQDRPPESRSLHELEAAWRNTTKHLQTESIVTEPEMRAAIEMAAAIAGGKDALRQRPILSIMQCTTSPLGHDGGSLDAGLLAAEAGLPVGYMTMTSCAFSGPVTMAGSLVVGNAEVISALALMHWRIRARPSTTRRRRPRWICAQAVTRAAGRKITSLARRRMC